MEKEIIREFHCQICGKLVQVTNPKDRRTKNCSNECMWKCIISRYQKKHPYTLKNRKLVSELREVKKDKQNKYYFIENGIKYRCSKEGFKTRELYSDDLMSKKSKGWTNKDMIELVGLKLGGLYKDRDIALLLERPICAIRNKFYKLKLQGLLEVYLKKFREQEGV